MTPGCKYRTSVGFTLIEVLIALSLSLVLAGMLFSSLHTYALSSAAGQTHLAAKQVSESVYQFIGDQLRESVPLALTADRRRNVLFHGDGEKIVYIGHIPRHRSAGGLHKNSLVIDGTPPHQSLIFTYERLNVDAAFGMDAFVETSSGTAKTLITDARSIEYGYFGIAEDEEVQSWATEWSNNDRLPELIRIRIDRENEPSPTDIVVPIYANAMSKRAAMSIGTVKPTTLNGRRQQRAAQRNHDRADSAEAASE